MKGIEHFPIPRRRRAGGYRSKAPALNETKQVSSNTYDPRSLAGAVADGQYLEVRGNCALGVRPARVSIALELLGRARVIR